MRWIVLCTLVVGIVGTAWCKMPYVSKEEVGSDLIKDRMEQAEDYLDKADRAFKDGQYVAAGFYLKDAEFELGRALDFALPASHMAAAYIREGIDKVKADMEEWGDGEDDKQVAAAWWERVLNEHAKGLATMVYERVGDDETLDAEELYWVSPYFTEIVEPEMKAFQEKYPDRDAFVALVPEAENEVGAGWAFCPADFRDKDPHPWVSEVVADAMQKLPDLEQASLPAILDQAKKHVLQEDGTGTPLYAIQASDGARVVLSRQPEDETAQKIIAKADEWIKKYQEKYTFKVENVRMPEDKNPGDAALHDQMKAAYEKEAAEEGWDEQVLRVVVTSDFSEGAEAWWVGDTIQTGYFKKIYGAVAVKQTEGCRVLYCLFRQQMVDGQWGDMYLGKVTTSTPILEENIAE